MLFEKVEPAIRCLSSGPKMKNFSGVEQFNQSKMNWDIDMIGHENDYEGLDEGMITTGSFWVTHRYGLLYKKNPAYKT